MERLSRRVAADDSVERSQITEVGGGLGMAWSVDFLVEGDGAPAEALSTLNEGSPKRLDEKSPLGPAG